MRYYISGSVQDMERCAGVMRFLEDAGHGITLDWTKCGTPETGFQACCMTNQMLSAVDRADRVGLITHDGMKAALIEVGYALAKFKPVHVLLDEPWHDSMFFHHPLIHSHTDEDGLIAGLLA